MTKHSILDLSNRAMLLLIVPHGRAEDIAHYALAEGASGVTAFLGHGTVPKRLLRALGLDEVRRELVVIILPELEAASDLLEKIKLAGHLEKNVFSIAFIQPLLDLNENGQLNLEQDISPSKADYRSLLVIVDRGEGTTVVDIARQNGAVGATIIEAMGSADHSAQVFDFEINPRKDLVLLVTDKEKAETIQQVLLDALRSSTPGGGISFMLNVTETLGIKGLGDETALLGGSWTAPTPSPHTALFILVNRPKTKKLIRTCEAAGSAGATIIHGRGIKKAKVGSVFFKESFDVERNLVLMLIKEEQEQTILRALRDLNETDTECALSVTATDAINFQKFSD
ncbi:MAG: hypothetical protein PHZ16_02895 [Eubacteriales bacterium]|nr:hypothetical protein [Eubacteriales bacterium]MDD3611156.1 hypothetical protein [Eubacteriales bacterium]